MTSNDIKSICDDVFEDYEVTDFKIDGNDAIIKIRPKNKIERLNNFLKIINSASDSIFNINNRIPI